MPSAKSTLGERGEALAVDLLKRRGYRILEKNFRIQRGEIDIIAQDRDTVCFIEVKTRRAFRQGAPSESISIFKQRQLVRLALLYLKGTRRLEEKARFDVVAVTMDENGKDNAQLIQNAFDLNDAGLTRYG